jgi:hypothetical protein
MAGQIKRMIDSIIQQRAKGDPLVRIMTRSKLILRGVNPDRFSGSSADDPEVIAIIKTIADELGTTMPVATAHSTKPLPDAVADLKLQSGNCHPRAVVFFASPRYEPHALSQQMQAAFPDACVVGCSTAGEIAAGQMMSGSVVAMFLDADVVEDAAAAVVGNLRSGPRVREAFTEFERRFQTPVSHLNIRKYVGLVLVDGLSGAEERLMEEIGNGTDVVFVGGAAGDDLRFQTTHVFAGGKAHTNAAVLVLLQLKRGFKIVKTQSFKLTGKRLVATEVDEALRKVVQFDHQPAVDAYAAALGVAQEQAATCFMAHPLGLMVNGDPFVRSPQRVDGHSVVFYCRIKQGMQLEVLEGTDIVADTRAAIEAQQRVMGPISGLIDFHCILRTLQLRNEKRCDQYGAIFSGIPAIGFSTYGEEYLGHINQTSTMLLFGVGTGTGHR